MTDTISPSRPAAGPASRRRAVKTWIDENTGREIRQLTDFAGTSTLPYFRTPKHLPDGRMLVHAGKGRGVSGRSRGYHLVDPETGDLEPLQMPPGGCLRLRPTDGQMIVYSHKEHTLYDFHVPTGRHRVLAQLPPDLPGSIIDITADRRWLVLGKNTMLDEGFPLPTTKDVEVLWRWFNRPRAGKILAYEIETGRVLHLVETSGACPIHHEAHPYIPGYVRYSMDWWEGHNQRIWAVRLDGSNPFPVRPQAYGELTTHEFFWPDGKYVAFTYQDRRNDKQHHELPWCEYAPVPTHLGIADLDGKQVYLSDPVNHYHTHLYCSQDGSLLSGSGTDGHSFVYAAEFSMKSTKVEYKPLATIHTPYVPFRGQGVNCDISADNRWMLYSDTVEGVHQLCAVRIEW